jgi:hypothetical protein
VIVWPALRCAPIRCVLLVRRLATAHAIGAHERHCDRRIGFGVMMALIAVAHAGRPFMLLVGAIGYIHLSELAGILRLHEGQSLLPVRQLHAVVIPLFILMGAIGRASGISTSLFRAAEAFAAGCAVVLPWP